MDDWLSLRKLRIQDLFRSQQFNRSNAGKNTENHDNMLDKHEVTDVLIDAVRRPRARALTHSLTDLCDITHSLTLHEPTLRCDGSAA